MERLQWEVYDRTLITIGNKLISQKVYGTLRMFVIENSWKKVADQFEAPIVDIIKLKIPKKVDIQLD